MVGRLIPGPPLFYPLNFDWSAVVAAEDLKAIEQNYQDLHEAGESWESITARVESVGDKRLAAFLRERAAGESGDDGTDAPKERRAGNKPVTASGEDTAETAAGEQAAE